MIRFESIRTSKSTKLIISCLAINLIFAGIYPSAAWALPEGPTQPEFNSFTPIGASDMVDLSSGDFNYSIPVMDVGGYPLSLGYSSSANFDTPSSWVGHGWDLSAGQINRSMRVIPDDFNGEDKIKTKNAIRPESTFILGGVLHPSLSGIDTPGINFGGNVGLALEYNNYRGFSLKPSFGLSLDIHKKFTTGLNLIPSSSEGVSLNPSIGYTQGLTTLGLGMNFNSYQGINSINGTLRSSFQDYSNDYFKINKNNLGINNSSSIDLSAPKSFTSSFDLGYVNSVGRYETGVGAKFLVFGIQTEAYASVAYRTLKGEYQTKDFSAYGFNCDDKANGDGMLDFVRSNDRVINVNTTTLPIPQYMYDIYNVSGQGIAGSFKPMRSQLNYVFDPKVKNLSASLGGGFDALIGIGELGFGTAVEANASYSVSNSGYWVGNGAEQFLKPNYSSVKKPNFNRTYYKLIGENTFQNSEAEPSSFIKKIGGNDPVNFKVKNNREIKGNRYDSKGVLNSNLPTFNEEIVQEDRIPTGKSIIPYSIKELRVKNEGIDNSQQSSFLYMGLNKIILNDEDKDHHQAGFRITDDSGAVYNYNQPLSTKKTVNNTFSVDQTDLSNGKTLIKYDDRDGTSSNEKGQDHFMQRKEIPSYVHTSLLKNILSPDYRDLTGDGASPDDMGSYTLFTYKKLDGVNKFRFPVGENLANYNEGMKSFKGDDKGSYSYGEKEQAFLERIVTKTHVAYFQLNKDTDEDTQRKDNLGVLGENGGVDENQRTRYLDKIYLYSLAQAESIGLLAEDLSNFNPAQHIALKTVHFDYDYSIQQATNNSSGLPNSKSDSVGNTNGKLTLKKVYFTYGKSEMGRYTPYSFEYNGDLNYSYHNMNKDIWGNYKPFTGDDRLYSEPSNAEFPYTDQDKTSNGVGDNPSDILMQMFLLSSIKLPSGGVIDVSYESDDYAYVQDQKAMKMYRIAGSGNDASMDTDDVNQPWTSLYSNDHGVNQFLYLELDKNDLNIDASQTNNDYLVNQINSNYLGELSGEPLYFKTLMNVHKGASSNPINYKLNEFITGYVYLQDANFSRENIFIDGDKIYISLPLQLPSLNGGGNSDVHPFSKATWLYGRAHMPRVAFDGEDSSVPELSPDAVLDRFFGDMESLADMFTGPNKLLRNQGSGQILYTNKSWLRLNEGSGFKLGGGSRVKTVFVDSNWDVMNNEVNSNREPLYGQEYNYTTGPNGNSSGVATFEPELSDENPLILPFEDRGRRISAIGTGNFEKLIDKFLAPASLNYVKGPLMEDYYPTPRVTYGKVETRNIVPEHPVLNSNLSIVKTKTGSVVNEFYTSKDFPTIEKNTIMDKKSPDNRVTNFLAELIGFPISLTSGEKFIASQGFSVETNDMNGKIKSQTVYPESGSNDQFISQSTYEYQIDEDGLDNEVTFIDDKGKISKQEVGVEYDMINDFRYSKSRTFSAGADVNVYTSIVIVPPPFFFFVFVTTFVQPNISNYTTEVRTVSTAKHIHRSGILKSTTVKDNGSSITTENIAYDYHSRNPIVKKVNNEYNDDIYNIDFPAYWVHPEMGNASFNDGMEFNLSSSNAKFKFVNRFNVQDSQVLDEDGYAYLNNGDEVRLKTDQGSYGYESFWVDQLNISNGTFDLIDKDGVALSVSNSVYTKAKVFKSAYDNKQGQSISSISLSKNPLFDPVTNNAHTVLPSSFNEDYKIYNASAIQMSNVWYPECESDFSEIPTDDRGKVVFDQAGEEINPYFNNILGQYRPVSSFAFLTGRMSVSDSENTSVLRKDGFYNKFNSFYQLNNNNWSANGVSDPNWTYASEVSKISPYGLELENKDALSRHSSAMYGFNKKFPTAVASNTAYKELGFDSFEDYDYIQFPGKEHFDFSRAYIQTKDNQGNYISSDNDISTVNPAYLVQYAHTGNNSLRLRANSAIGIEKQLKPCDNVDVGGLFLNLLEYIWENKDDFNNQSCYENPLSIPEFAALYPYIYKAYGDEVEPSICNLGFYELETGIVSFGFNFYDNYEHSSPRNDEDLQNRHVRFLTCPLVEETLDLSDFELNGSTTNSSDLKQIIGFEHIRPRLGSNESCEGEFKSHLSYIDFKESYCVDCTSFSLNGNENYVVSAWVSQSVLSARNTPEGLRDSQPLNYLNTGVGIGFYDENKSQLNSVQELTFFPSGQIINGWQKVYGVFNVNDQAHYMKVVLDNGSNNTAFFDDVRIHPVDGSMKSFVYDRDNFRLLSELDDNNFATFYEYDLEGNLIRIKKETSRGIMTIQESRQGFSEN